MLQILDLKAQFKILSVSRQILVKNRNFGEKGKFWLKNELSVKNRKFRQKSKFSLKSIILSKVQFS